MRQSVATLAASKCGWEAARLEAGISCQWGYPSLGHDDLSVVVNVFTVTCNAITHELQEDLVRLSR